MSNNFMDNANATSVVTAIGNKIKARDKTFYGTEEQWAALSTAQKKEYDFKATPDGGARSSSIFILANKFDHSDLYSTEEKVIGVWTDGKPLYQKTINFDTFTLAVDTSTYKDITGISLDKLIHLEGSFDIDLSSAIITYYVGHDYYNDADTSLAVKTSYYVTSANHSVRIRFRQHISSQGISIDNFNCTIQYTKTTDSPILIGSDTDYTTSEKMIGTWINGKPLYQKTVPITITVNTDLTSVTSYADVSALNVDNIVDVRGMLFQGTSPSSAQTPISFSSWVNADDMVKYIVQPWFNKDNNRLCIDCNRLSYSGKIAYITIQYTKTTD